MNTKQVIYPQTDRWSYLWLLIGIVLSALSFTAYGKWSFRWRPGLLTFLSCALCAASAVSGWLAYLILVLANVLYMWFVLPSFLVPLRLSIVIGSALAGSLIPMVDRLLVACLRGFTAPLFSPWLPLPSSSRWQLRTSWAALR